MIFKRHFVAVDDEVIEARARGCGLGPLCFIMMFEFWPVQPLIAARASRPRGFAPAEVDKLMPAENLAAVEEIDVSTVADRFRISVHGPLAIQTASLQKLKALMAEVPGVIVEQGTITDG
jgi:hypothetical protein